MDMGNLTRGLHLLDKTSPIKNVEKTELGDSRFCRVVFVGRILRTNYLIKITLFGFESLVNRNC